MQQKIIQIDLQTIKEIQTFESITKACKYLGIDKEGMCQGISKCCKGKRNSAFGYGWKYIDE